MNYLQLALFIVFALSALCAGAGLFVFLKEKDALMKKRLICLGESWLLGSICLIGQLLLLSLVGWYKAEVLWGVVVLQYGFLLNPSVRRGIGDLFARPWNWNLPRIIFALLMAVFVFRNYYFLVDVDSHSTYLYAQKLWLAHGTSIFADRGIDTRTFVSHFDCVPYGLGISLFKEESLLFCQFINVFWRVIVLLLVFGYTEYRLGGYSALAASCFILFNDHFFISGINHSVLINGAVIAFIFAGVYNFWESREQGSAFRFLLAVVFASQLIANKYQLGVTFLFILFLGTLAAKDLPQMFREISRHKNWLCVLLAAYLIGGLWFIKNYFATGNPIYPILASKSRVIGFSPDMDQAFYRVFGGSTPFEFLKYMNYFFIWPGMDPAKYVIITISLLPLLGFFTLSRGKVRPEEFVELCFWLGVSILVVMGTVLGSHPDPRYFRYGIGVLSFCSVLALQYILKYLFFLKNGTLRGLLIVIVSFSGFFVIFQTGGSAKVPTFRDNLAVLLDQLHARDVVSYHYPNNVTAAAGAAAHPEMVQQSAWFEGVGGVTRLSAFLLPAIRPQAGLWYTTIVRWDSYANQESIVEDIKDYGLQWIMNGEGDQLVFLSPEEYAKQAVTFQRYPKAIFYQYDLVPEITRTGY